MRRELRERAQAARSEVRAQRLRLTDLIDSCTSTARGARHAVEGEGVRLFTRDVLKLGGAEVLVSRQSIRDRDGRRHRLTPTEWQLLAFLLANPGQILSRAELSAGAWGPGFTERDSEVEVYVSRLRRKLGSSSDLLETVRGRGYRLLRRRR